MKKVLFTAILMFLSVALIQGQSIIGVVEYLKVENRNTFKTIQEKWMKIHQSRVELDEITGWSIYEVSSRMTTQPYNYVRITYFDSFLEMEAAISESAVQKAYPGMSKESWRVMVNEEKACCQIASSGVFYREIGCQQGLDRYASYFMINEITVNPGRSRDYLVMQEEYFKPVYDELIKNKECTAWSIWAKWSGKSENYQFVTSEGFQTLEKIETEDLARTFGIVHHGLDYSQINKNLEGIKETKNTEVWKVIFRVMK
ncbi:MAG: hypothetical protein U5K79_06315 [Cyclobacteriaceae bacterium]|nr:hypothetical protein [Cyclobacteriaceae bacterium]